MRKNLKNFEGIDIIEKDLFNKHAFFKVEDP